MLPTLKLYFTFCGVTRFHDSKLLTYVVVPTDDEWRINFTRKRFNFEEKKLFLLESVKYYFTDTLFLIDRENIQIRLYRCK